ncbi:helix-turn-helix transcriptional regulator [Ruegeria arenilitoris]|uniref:helix-turn-helix transcriptional regulator n=1 Tax=Ruegeria arenilitoris TaxID=1173585 RepID=UPI001C2C8421|nr:helix-turn-helix domain-containing protein [Ruegeria arenilitoris]
MTDLHVLSEQIESLRAIVLRSNAPEIMDPREAATYLGVTDETLYRWRKDATGPKYSQPNARVIRYLRDDLIEWMRENQ